MMLAAMLLFLAGLALRSRTANASSDSTPGNKSSTWAASRYAKGPANASRALSVSSSSVLFFGTFAPGC